MTDKSQSLTPGLRRDILFWLGGAALLGLCLFALKSVLAPFALGLAIAYLLDPLADRLEKRGLGRTTATACVLLGFVLVFVVAVTLSVPVLQGQFTAFVDALPQYIEKARAAVDPWLDRLQSQIAVATGDADLKKEAAGYASTVFGWGAAALKGTWNGGLAVFDLIAFLFIAPIVSFYMLRDWDRLVAKIDSWIPRRHVDTVRKLAHQSDQALSEFIRGQAMVCFILGAFYAVGLTAAGLNFGFFIGFVAGILTFMPYVGTIVGFAVGLAVAWFQYDGEIARVAVIAGIFGVGQFLEGNFLSPKIVGDRVGLHPLWIVFALMAGGSLLGFLGVLLAVPVAAVAGVLTRFAIAQYMDSDYYKARAAAKTRAASKA